MNDTFATPLELKFAGDGATGEFTGYGAVFGNVDGHGDLLLPGAFADSLAQRKAQGRGLPMHVMHGVFGGDGVPVGVWKSVEEDSKGLAVQGKISGMNTDAGRLLYERVKDGALPGLSIGYRVKQSGAIYGTKAGEPRRTIKAAHLHEISLVDDPANALARVDQVKHRLAGGELPTIREFEERLREMGFSRAQATQVAERGFKSLATREGDGDVAIDPEEMRSVQDALRGFSLNSV